MSPVLGHVIVIALLLLLVFFCGRVVVRDIRGSLSGKCGGCGGSYASCGGSCASCGMNCEMRRKTGSAGKTAPPGKTGN